MKSLFYVLALLFLLGLILHSIQVTFFFLVSSPWIPILVMISIGYLIWGELKKNPQTYHLTLEGLSAFRRQKPLLFWSGAAFAILFMVSMLRGGPMGSAAGHRPEPAYQTYTSTDRPSSGSSRNSTSDLGPSCRSNLEQLNSILLAMNSKIMAMPPIATIYTSSSQVYRDAIAARDAGNFEECVRLSDIAIRHSEVYAR
jgi:hypothetical protein